MARGSFTVALLLLLFTVVAEAAVISGVTRCDQAEDCRDPDEPSTGVVCVANLCYKTRRGEAKEERNGDETVHICQVFRDFESTHPDMELSSFSAEPGIVQGALGPDGTPVYNAPTTTVQDSDSFFQWFHDVEGVNCRVDYVLDYVYTPGEGSYAVINDGSYFKMDGKCSHVGGGHNFHFTMDMQICMRANSDEQAPQLQTQSDDDLFVFVNKTTLAIDNGGVHAETMKIWTGTVQLDTLYVFDVFYAERHTSEAKLRLTFLNLEPVPCCEGECCGAVCCDDDESSSDTFTAESDCALNECATDADCAAFVYDDACSCAFCCNGVCMPVLDRCDDGDDTTEDVCTGHGTTCEHYPIAGELSLCQYTRWTTLGACMTHDWQSDCDEPSTMQTVHEKNCNDGDPTTDDTCDDRSGNCTHMSNECHECACNCNDGNECTVDTCDPVSMCCNHTQLVCDDNDMCTLDWCDHFSGGCNHLRKDCDDHNACTAELCNSTTGACEYMRKNCSDGDVCTLDECDRATGECSNPPKCTHSSLCVFPHCDTVNGNCSYTRNPCDDFVPCTDDSCDDETGQCVHTEIDCDDENLCTHDWHEVESSTGDCVCKHSQIPIDDGHFCTDDTCDPATGRPVHLPHECDRQESNACVNSTCWEDPEDNSIGECRYAMIICDDGLFCTIDECEHATGECFYSPRQCDHHESSACVNESCWEDPQNPGEGECRYDVKDCSTGVECLIGECDPISSDCIYSELDCDDDDWCTSDSCDNSTGCYHNLTVCEYSDPCFPKVCHSATGECVEKPIICDDGNPHTNDNCVEGECVYTHIECDDFNLCTDNVLDLGGVCHHPLKDCDDHNECTADSCNLDDGHCIHDPVTCPQRTPCFVPHCFPGNGECYYTPKDCDDRDPCTDDSCDLESGDCLHEPKTCPDPRRSEYGVDPEARDEARCPPGGPPGCGPWPPGSKCWIHYCHKGTGECERKKRDCDDRDERTYDWCDHETGGCKHLTKQCDDQDPCTDDYLDPLDGRCKHTEKDCTDGDLCTMDRCNNRTGECIHAPKRCDDQDLCTHNMCNPKTGQCYYPDVDCDDQDPCTLDRCNPDNGECQHRAKLCDDADPCTLNYCHPKTGECFNPDKDCDDGDWCTNDLCRRRTGECYHELVRCPTANACRNGFCHKSTGECMYPLINCDDGDWCTNDFCNATGDGCYHELVVYDDPECQKSHCHPATGERVMEMLEDTTRCNITDPCTHSECFNGECLAQEELDCRPRPNINIVVVIIVSLLGLLALIAILLMPTGASRRRTTVIMAS